MTYRPAKRLTAAIAGVSALALVLSACSSSNNGSSTSSAAASSAAASGGETSAAATGSESGGASAPAVGALPPQTQRMATGARRSRPIGRARRHQRERLHDDRRRRGPALVRGLLEAFHRMHRCDGHLGRIQGDWRRRSVSGCPAATRLTWRSSRSPACSRRSSSPAARHQGSGRNSRQCRQVVRQRRSRVTAPSTTSTSASRTARNFKSLVWYSPKDFKAKGYEVPKTYDELIALSDKIAATGAKPWCAGIASGEATGWHGDRLAGGLRPAYRAGRTSTTSG